MKSHQNHIKQLLGLNLHLEKCSHINALYKNINKGIIYDK